MRATGKRKQPGGVRFQAANEEIAASPDAAGVPPPPTFVPPQPPVPAAKSTVVTAPKHYAAAANAKPASAAASAKPAAAAASVKPIATAKPTSSTASAKPAAAAAAFYVNADADAMIDKPSPVLTQPESGASLDLQNQISKQEIISDMVAGRFDKLQPVIQNFGINFFQEIVDSKNNWNIFFWSIHHNHKATTGLFHNDVFFLTHSTPSGENAFLLAASKGNWSVAERALKHKPDLITTTWHNLNALSLVLIHKRWTIAERLLCFTPLFLGSSRPAEGYIDHIFSPDNLFTKQLQESRKQRIIFYLLAVGERLSFQVEPEQQHLLFKDLDPNLVARDFILYLEQQLLLKAASPQILPKPEARKDHKPLTLTRSHDDITAHTIDAGSMRFITHVLGTEPDFGRCALDAYARRRALEICPQLEVVAGKGINLYKKAQALKNAQQASFYIAAHCVRIYRNIVATHPQHVPTLDQQKTMVRSVGNAIFAELTTALSNLAVVENVFVLSGAATKGIATEIALAMVENLRSPINVPIKDTKATVGGIMKAHTAKLAEAPKAYAMLG